jgi:N-carbamoylputrescine amidase
MAVGLVQMSCCEDPAENLARAEQRVRHVAREGGEIVCLQELFSARYFCQTEDTAYFDLAEPLDGPTIAHMRRLAAELEIVLIVPFFERRAPGIYHNSAAVIDADGSVLGLYRKMHIPDDPQYLEKFYFTPGDLGYRAFRTRYGVVGVLICWDQWFPEAARLTALEGAEILFYPTAIGWLPDEKSTEGDAQLDAWRTVQRSHAIVNGVFVAAGNRVGHEESAAGGLEFWGSSLVCDPRGEVLAEAPTDAEDCLIVQCDRAAIEEFRRGWPFLRDRRIDSYGGMTSRFGGEGP